MLKWQAMAVRQPVPRFDAAEQPAASASDEQFCHAAKYELGYQKNAYAGQRGASLACLFSAASGVTRASYLSGLARKSRIKHRIAMNASKRLELLVERKLPLEGALFNALSNSQKAWHF